LLLVVILDIIPQVLFIIFRAKGGRALGRFEMICHIAIGLILGFFGLWFFWFETVKEFMLLDFALISSGDTVKMVQLSSDLIIIFVRMIVGFLIFLWMILGCVFATIKQYQNQKLEEIAREETRKIQEQMLEEARKRLEGMSSEEKAEAKKEGWLW
jgi:predicted membrane protein